MPAILIVEDDMKIQSQIEIIINNISSDVKILKSSEGKKALAISKTMEIDVFIIDIGLPDWDGIELAKELRKTYPYQPIIIESSQEDAKYKVEVYDEIANLAFLTKPYTSKIITNKIKYALNIADTLGNKKLNIKQNSFSRQIDINDILYVEKIKSKRRIEIIQYTHDTKRLIKEEFVGISLNALLDMLEDSSILFRCHKSYIINPKMIEKLNYANDTVILKYTDEEIPIGKTFKKAIALLF